MNESSSYPHFGGRAVWPLGQENLHLNGRGHIVFAIEHLRSPDPPIVVAEVAAVLRHFSAHPRLLWVGKQNDCTNVTAVSATYT
jgi:hypothetical protein